MYVVVENGVYKKRNEINGKKRSKAGFFLLIFVFFIVVVFIVAFFFRGCKNQESQLKYATPIKDSDSAMNEDTLILDADIDSVSDSIDYNTHSDTTDSSDSTPEQSIIDTISQYLKIVPDTVVNDTPTTVKSPTDLAMPDTIQPVTLDTMNAAEDSCGADTAQLWVYPDPSGGLHNTSVAVMFVSNRTAEIHYRTEADTSWRQYTGTSIPITQTTTLHYDAIDSCGAIMERRSEYYEIVQRKEDRSCDSSMVHIKVGSMDFCIDRYEWPNRKGKKPQTFISYYEAADSCYSVGKRLCTADEWSIACSGPYSWTYPYGKRYERYGCSTHDSGAVASGIKPECRSFFGVFDMSGNLLEWTSTKSVENSAFYYVMGGFWESGPKSGCFSKRYSYYPQNQHNPVGFRCCRNISVSSGAVPEGGDNR